MSYGTDQLGHRKKGVFIRSFRVTYPLQAQIGVVLLASYESETS